eukprot:gene1638-2206_t
MLAAPRALWLLDEPLSPLDSRWRTRIGDIMQQHLDSGGMILAAVHDPLPVARRSLDLAAETALAWGRGGGPLVAVGFYAGVATLLPLAIGPEPQRLAAIATGAAWVALALASLLSLDRLFERDFEDGALDLLTLSPVPLELTCFIKCMSHWLIGEAGWEAVAEATLKWLEDARLGRAASLSRSSAPMARTIRSAPSGASASCRSCAVMASVILITLGTCDGDMEKGNLRADVNVSVCRVGQYAKFRADGDFKHLGTRCEIKNVNSYRYIQQAIEYEARRQIEILEDGGKIDQETRLFDPGKMETRSMRSKEEAHDYRYFPDPDLLPLELDPAWVKAIEATLPELPDAKKARLQTQYGLTAYDAGVLIIEQAILGLQPRLLGVGQF